MKLMLTLDDAVKVCMRLLHNTNYFDDMPEEERGSTTEYIRSEFEQKCWFLPDSSDPAKRLSDMICDVNPAEIANQIEVDNLRQWCEIMQNEMSMTLIQLPCWGV